MSSNTSGSGVNVQGAARSRPNNAERAISPRSNANSQSRTLPFQQVRDRALPQMETICRAWLPNGRRQGNWWLANVPWRNDTNASLGVSLTSGLWRDFADPSVRGDVIDLAQKIFGMQPREAVEKLAAMLGVN